MNQFNLQPLRDLPIEEVAERLGLEVIRHKALCPFHDDHHASLSFNTRRNTFRCFVCGEHGGTIDLVMRTLHKDFRQACTWLSNDSIEPPQTHSTHSAHSPHKPLQPLQTHQTHPTQKTHTAHFDPSRYAPYFERPYLSPEARQFLFDQRRLDPRVVRWCRLTSWRDKQGVNWLQIPYYDRNGNLVGIQNRNLNYHPDPQPSTLNSSLSTLNSKPSTLNSSLLTLNSPLPPRFRFPAGSQCGIYNLPVLNLLHDGEPLWIAEGASDCWALLSAGHKAIAIPSATLLKPNALDPLLTLHSQLLTPFHMAPDRDEPGERLFLQLQSLLPNLTHHHLPPDCKDFSDYYLKYNPHQPP